MIEPQTSTPITFEASWRKIASAPPGGTVVGLAADREGRLWLASPAGLFHRAGSGWAPVVKGLPFNELNAIYGVSRTIFAAGLPAGIAYTTEDGRRWYASRSDQTRQPVTCFSASPAFNRDGVVLAGTHGDGILRSSDGGRYWNLSNFGLRHFEIFALLSAPDWSEREQVYAGTSGGLYESPNGGRAWRPLGQALQDHAVLSLALLPSPDQSNRAGGILLAGTEQGGLFRSTDGGQTWVSLELGTDPGPINSLWAGQDGVVLAGTGGSGIMRSADGGQSWQPVSPQNAAALCLLAARGKLYAGLHEGGLLLSDDGGLTWQVDPDLRARRFDLLASATQGGWLAGGPTAGLWLLPPGEPSWQAAAGWPEERPLYALASGEATVLAASLDGVWVSHPDLSGWTLSLQTGSGINLLASHGKLAWAGHVTGGLWRTDDGGGSWQPLPFPFQRQALVGLAVSPHYETDRTLLAASAFPPHQELNFWRSQDGGRSWSAWFKENTYWYALQLAPSGEQAAESSFGFGLTVLTQSPDGLRRAEITGPEAPISALLALPESSARIASAGHSLQATLDGQDWRVLSDGLPEDVVVNALALSPDFSRQRLVFALTTTGELWARKM